MRERLIKDLVQQKVSNVWYRWMLRTEEFYPGGFRDLHREPDFRTCPSLRRSIVEGAEKARIL